MFELYFLAASWSANADCPVQSQYQPASAAKAVTIIKATLMRNADPGVWSVWRAPVLSSEIENLKSLSNLEKMSFL